MYTPQDRSATRYPPTNYNAMPVSMSSNPWDDDQLEKAGAADRTFDMDTEPYRQSTSGRMHQQTSMDTTPYIPPLPVDESWNEGIPPLPEVCLALLPPQSPKRSQASPSDWRLNECNSIMCCTAVSKKSLRSIGLFFLTKSMLPLCEPHHVCQKAICQSLEYANIQEEAPPLPTEDTHYEAQPPLPAELPPLPEHPHQFPGKLGRTQMATASPDLDLQLTSSHCLDPALTR